MLSQKDSFDAVDAVEAMADPRPFTFSLCTAVIEKMVVSTPLSDKEKQRN